MHMSSRISLKFTTHGRLNRFRIDATHANPRSAWKAMGSPTYPTEAQMAVLETASELVWISGGVSTGATTMVLPPDTLVVIDIYAS